MLAAPALLPLASPAIGPKRSIGRRGEPVPVEIARPQEPQQQGSTVHQARPFLAHVQKDVSQKQLGVRRLGSPPKEPLQRQTSTRRVGSPPKEALQRQTSTRRVGSPPPAPTKSGSPTPAQAKRCSATAHEEASVHRPRPGHQSPRGQPSGTGARQGPQISRVSALVLREEAARRETASIPFLKPQGSTSNFLYVPKGSSIEGEPVAEHTARQLGASLVHNDGVLRGEYASTQKPSSVLVRPNYDQQCPDAVLPAGSIANMSQDVKNNSEQVQSDTASTASQEHVQVDTASNSSQDLGISPDPVNFDPMQAALVWTPRVGASPEPSQGTVLWTPRVGASKEHVKLDVSKSESSTQIEVSQAHVSRTAKTAYQPGSNIGSNMEPVNFDTSQTAVVWNPRTDTNIAASELNPPGEAHKEHVNSDTRKAALNPQTEANPAEKEPQPNPSVKPRMESLSCDCFPSALVWTPRSEPRTTVTSDPSPQMAPSQDIESGASQHSPHSRPRMGASLECNDGDAAKDAADRRPCAETSLEEIKSDTGTSKAISLAPSLSSKVQGPADAPLPIVVGKPDVSAAEGCPQLSALSSGQIDGGKDCSVLAASAGKDQKQGGEVNVASGAASPHAPRCVARSPQQRVLRSRSPPSTMERCPEKTSRGLDATRGMTRMSQGSLEAFAAECQNVCQTYEKNLHELQLLCSAIDRTAQSPRGGTSRQSNCGTPDSSCRPSCRGTVRTSRASGGSKSTTPDQSWRALHEGKKASTPERNWRMTAGRKDAGTPERNWRSSVRKDASTPERSVRAPCLHQGQESSRGLRGTDAASQERTPRPSMAGKGSTPSLSTKFASRPQAAQGMSRTDSFVPHISGLVKDEPVVQSLLGKGFLTQTPAGWINDPVGVPDDIAHVRTMFSAQVPEASALSVYRVKHDGHSLLYKAVQETMESKTECILWHGTSLDSVRNIALNGFNRNYCGRHGMKLGYGTYFSSSADYSVRFCDRRSSKRVMFLAKVLVGTWTKGSQEMKEPPFRDNEGIVRYDSTVDSVESPSMFCVFRDYQAVPLYLIEFSGPS